MVFTYALRSEFVASYNEVVARLRIAEQMGVKNLAAKVEFLLVVNQINGSYIEKEQSMIKYMEKAKTLICGFKKFSIEQVLRSENKKVDVKPVAIITGNQIKKIVWDNIVCRFGLPREIIYDNGKKFRDNPFKDWCDKLNIKQKFASVKHPQTNGLVERANCSLGEGIKARLDQGSKNWVEEVQHVLWAHHTMIKTSNGDTPLYLTYGTEVVIPVEIGMPSLRCAEVDQVQNDEALMLNLDMLEEKRERAAIREAKSNARMKKYYNAKVRSTTFKPGDFVYRSNEASHAKEGGKLGLK
ncbi:reverse transcriptase domain-containing protein [Tanacetum coccineum]